MFTGRANVKSKQLFLKSAAFFNGNNAASSLQKETTLLSLRIKLLLQS